MSELFCVDAFAERAFQGNPAAVCLLDRSAEGAWMQSVAAEMNLSETAFVWPQEGRYGLRWFTPTVEVALCGHATLASAHVLHQARGLMRVEFQTVHSGVLTTQVCAGGIEMDFPARPAQACECPAGLAEALGVRARFVGKTSYDYLVEVGDEAEVRALNPDQKALLDLGVRGVIVTAPGREFDFVSRFFAPGAGVAEDPVTGSAHCSLAPHWAPRLAKLSMRAYQASPRGGIVRVTLEGDRVRLVGTAHTVWRGELLV